MKKILVLVMCFMFVGVVNVSAEIIKAHTWDLGTEISHIRYEEPGLMKEDGMMFGIVGSYAYHNRLMLKAEGKGSCGQVDYSSPYSGIMNGIPDFMLELRGLVGYDYPILEGTVIAPYVGLGYRYLNDDSSGKLSTIGHAGYERESNYLYSPMGIETITELKNGWAIGGQVEYDIFWQGKQISHLGDADPWLSDVENDQKSGWGCRASLKVRKNTEKVDFLAEPFIRYWDIDKSDTNYIVYPGLGIASVWEPANTSTEVGIKLAVRF